MKNVRATSMAIIVALLVFAAIGCSVSTANLSSLKVSKDKEGKTEATSFKAGETFYGRAIVANNPGKVKVKFTLADPKGEAMKGADVNVDIDGEGTATYTLATTEEMPAGTYKLTADMINDAGEKKDSKTATVTLTE